MGVFKIHREFKPAGDQPKAIKELVSGIKTGLQCQTLLGVTGSGKTFTVANVIEKISKPTLVIAHNKTLAAQLAQEYREFFPDNAVHYFVSYYDYYQPEAYLPITDTYIEKEAMINEEIERLRHATTQALLTRKDVIIVASVSCIYGLGNPEEYKKVNMKIEKGQKVVRANFVRELIDIHYSRTNSDVKSGTFLVIGNAIEIMPVSERILYRIEIEDGKINTLKRIDAVSRTIISEPKIFFLFPTKHFITEDETAKRALLSIKEELTERLAELNKVGKLLEAERLKRRTTYDLALIREIGYTNGIENYSRHFSDKKPGEAPYTLLDYFPKKKDGTPDFLTIIDESHVTVPQIGGMYAGDKSRKDVLIEHGFRLPSALDNRPLKFEEFEGRVKKAVYVSATPGDYEFKKSGGSVVEQIIRPTGLMDPEIEVRPASAQVDDLLGEIKKRASRGQRTLVTTLTKRLAEDLTQYYSELGVRVKYLHSDIETLERVEILRDLRLGEFDVLVGINLLREGLDLPEVALVAILDADKEGFLRSE